jgi:formylglycine-generating enzyme required for sulfatase activity
MDLHALQPGYLLAEYKIVKLLGEGGFGLTYLAFDTHLEKKVAVKEYMPSDFSIRQNSTTIVPKSEASKTDYEWGLEAFINEAKTLAKFDDINIVRIHRFFKQNGTAYLIMEFCEGGCLSERFSEKKPMSEPEVQALITPLMNGLQLVHEANVYHRDIKPDNIMFRSDGAPVLIDFGAARQVLGAKSRSITTIVTPGYAPIEQYSSKGKLGPWTDIYSLAAVAYACLTGQRPADATDRVVEDDIEPLATSVDASSFIKSIDQALSVKASNRPQDLSDWYEIWNPDKINEAEKKALKNDFSALDGALEMAGSDGVISCNEMQFLLKKAKQLNLNTTQARAYIEKEAIIQGWKVDEEVTDKKVVQDVTIQKVDKEVTSKKVVQDVISQKVDEVVIDKKVVQEAIVKTIEKPTKVTKVNKVPERKDDKKRSSNIVIIAMILLISSGGYYGYNEYSDKDNTYLLAEKYTGKMLPIPEGSFYMGSNENKNEKPVHGVSVKAFKMSQTEVTFSQWDACVSAGGCSYKPEDKGWGRGNRPVMNVSYNDITKEYIPWLNKITRTTGNEKYRLPSEAEWEFAARAGSRKKYSRNYSVSCSQDIDENLYDACGTDRKTDRIKSYSPNGFELYDMHGNVWEWTQDCWGDDGYAGAPTNGKARIDGDCTKRVLRGGSWDGGMEYLRSSSRNRYSRSTRHYYIGFRLVQTDNQIKR